MQKLEILMSRIADQPTIKALRKGLMYWMPFTLIGAFSLALFKLPIPAYQNFMTSLFGRAWASGQVLTIIHRGTFNIMSLGALITISYTLATEKKLVKSGEIDAVFFIATVLASFFIFVGNPGGNSNIIISNRMLSAISMHKVIIIAIVASLLLEFFYRWTERVRVRFTYDYNGSALLRSASQVILPAFLTILTFSIARITFDRMAYNNVFRFNIINKIAEKYVTGNNFFTAVIFIVTVHILWFLGIHGGSVVVDAIASATSTAECLIGGSIFTKRFFDTYVYLGGYGVTLGLLIALILVTKKSSEDRIARVSILPSLLNINESIMFGLPVIFNTYLLVPFITVPIVLTLITWIAISLGWVPLVTRDIDWTTPIFMSGYVGTGHISAVIMQAVNLTLSVLIYVPFVKLQMKNQERMRRDVFKSLIKQVLKAEEENKNILNRHDETGVIARELARDLREGFNNNPILHLEYQPKSDYSGGVVGAEALLRWQHPIYGYVSPLVILHICDGAGLTNELGSWVVSKAFEDLGKWHKVGYKVSLSVNLNPLQLSTDNDFVKNLKNVIEKNKVNPKYMELEITENATLDLSKSTQEKLEEIRSFGMNIAIDDFGMGHSSLLYLTDFHANIIKSDI